MKKNRSPLSELLIVNRQASFLIMFFAALFAVGAFVIIAENRASGKNEPNKTSTSQNRITGEWTAELISGKPGQIQMSFHRRSEKSGGFNMWSDSMLLSEFQGLTSEITTSAAKTNVNFSLVREAGSFQCEGFFREGRGAGFWTFNSDQNFVSALRGRGYENLTDEDLLRAAMSNLTTKLIEDLKSLGYERLEFQKLLRAANHDITPNYIREMQSAGYQGLTMDELIRARNHDIDAQYIKEVQGMGFGHQPLEKIIRLRNHEITQAFINQMRSAGFENLSLEQLIRLKNHDITPQFVNGLKAEGYSAISAETAIRLKSHEIDRDFIQRVKARGFSNLTLEQLIRLRSQDIIK